MVGNSDFSPGSYPQFTSEIQEIESPEGELHLRFFLPSGTEFALPAEGIREVMQHPPERITPIPNASPLLLGTINLRGQVIWVADLGQFLGDTTPLNTERSELPILAVEDQDTLLGLAIDQIGQMKWLDLENIQLQLSNNVPDNMAPFIRGEWVLENEGGKMLRLLDHVAVLRSARWAT